ncbi:MAG: cohesin domain-containing protein [Desulfotomaculaceae bacterium]|nr:cohesin domain-containing protein [Desulfotomaculaceae bacterium]
MRSDVKVRRFLCCCILTVFIWQFHNTASAAEIACEAVKPYKPSEILALIITLTDVYDLSSIEFKLHFDKDVIELVPDETTGKAFINGALLGKTLVVKNEVTSTGDTLWFAAARTDDSTLNVLGKATLGTVKFKTLKEDESSLTFIKTLMMDSSGTYIKHSYLDGCIDGIKPYVATQMPVPGSIIYDLRPVVSATVGDALSGVNPAALSVKLDGIAVAAEKNSNYISYVPEQNLDIGSHTVTIYLEDYAANEEVSAWSFMVAEGGTIKGRILPQGIKSGLDGTSVFLEKDGITLNTLTAPDASYEFQNITPGSYDLLAKRPGFLSQNLGGQSIQPGQSVVVADKEIPFGDLDGDDVIGLSDLVEIARAYAQESGGALWLPIYDNNQNGKVDLQDIETLGVNYGLFTNSFTLLK